MTSTKIVSLVLGALLGLGVGVIAGTQETGPTVDASEWTPAPPTEPTTTTPPSPTTTAARPPSTTTSAVQPSNGMSPRQVMPEFDARIMMVRSLAPGLASFSTPGGTANDFEVLAWEPNEPEPQVLYTVEDGQLAVFDRTASYLLTMGTATTLDSGLVLWAGPVDRQPAPLAVRVNGAAWHDERPGWLAWVEFAADGSPHLWTLDLAEESGHRQRVAELDASGWLLAWGDWGFAIGRALPDRIVSHIIDPDGSPIVEVDGLVATSLEDGRLVALPVGPAEDAYVVQPDGSAPEPVPWLDEEEGLLAVDRSGGGSLTALSVVDESVTADGISNKLMVVDTTTGQVVATADLTPTESSFLGGTAAFDPTERFVVLRQGSLGLVELKILDLDTGRIEELPLSAVEGRVVTAVAVVP